MGKRKSRKKPPPKKTIQRKLSTLFNCPFCNHEKSVSVQISHKEGKAVLRCNKCNESFETEANYLSEPIDIFGEWCDEIAAANENPEGVAVADVDESGGE